MQEKKTILNAWLPASVAGSLWATSEIIAGSFLHNLHIPFAGAFLAFLAIILLVAFDRAWPSSFLFIKAGVVCALMKTMSPSYAIVGPAIGILAESVMLQLAVGLSGRNIFGYLAGGALAMITIPAYFLFSLWLKYGSRFFEMLLNALPQSAASGKPQTIQLLLVFIAVVFMLTGIFASLSGIKLSNYYLNKRDFNNLSNPGSIVTTQTAIPYENRKELLLAPLVIIVLLVSEIWILETINFIAASTIIITINLGMIYYYPSLTKIYRQWQFWLQFIVILVIALIFSGHEYKSIFSAAGIENGLAMNLRALVIISSFSALSSELGNKKIKRYFIRFGKESFYSALESAFGFLPGLLADMPKTTSKLFNPLFLAENMMLKADQLFIGLGFRPRIVIITGDIHEGKTTYVKQLAEKLEQKFRVTAIFSEPVFKNNKRIGYDLTNNKTVERIPFCRDTDFESSFHYRKYFFSIKAFERANAMLINSTDEVLIADEAGLLETEFGQGWNGFLSEIMKKPEKNIILVVRRPFIGKLSSKYKFIPYLIADIHSMEIETAAKQIFQIFSS